jgi:hypothetical protein
MWNPTGKDYLPGTTHFVAVDISAIPDTTGIFSWQDHGVRKANMFIEIYGNGTRTLDLSARLVGGGPTGIPSEKDAGRIIGEDIQ